MPATYIAFQKAHANDHEEDEENEGSRKRSTSDKMVVPAWREWLSPKEAAALVKLSVDVIYDACKTGALRSTKPHGRIRIRRDWLSEWMERAGH